MEVLKTNKSKHREDADATPQYCISQKKFQFNHNYWKIYSKKYCKILRSLKLLRYAYILWIYKQNLNSYTKGFNIRFHYTKIAAVY